MKKNEIIDFLREKVEKDLNDARGAYESTSSYKDSDMTKSDGKYDTRAIESGYLAGAQKKRVDELELELQLLAETPAKDFVNEEPISVGAMMELEINNQIQRYFLCSTGGGNIIPSDSGPIIVISPFSPIGAAAINLVQGDSFEVETPKETREYVIIKVW